MLIGVRHYDHLMHAQTQRLSPEFLEDARGKWEQGFIDQWGVFMDRKEAFVVAHAANQIKAKTGNADSIELYSEDL